MAVPTAVTIPSRLAAAPVSFTFAAAPTSATEIDWMPGDMLIAFNSSPDTGYTATATSNPKSSRASETITSPTIAAGAYYIFPRFPDQDGGKMHIHAANAAIKFARLSTRAQPS